MALAVRNPELHRALESLLRADAEAAAHLAPFDAAFLLGSRPSDRLFAAIADRYRVEREIGSGGMATVYLAHDLKHDRDVAVKVFRPELAAVFGTNRFLNEIRNVRMVQPSADPTKHKRATTALKKLERRRYYERVRSA